jgi:hypothetical protein
VARALAQLNDNRNVKVESSEREMKKEISMTTAELERETKITLATGTRTTMKALVYHGPGKRAWEDKSRPNIQDPGDAIVRITTSTICGTDLHILKGDYNHHLKKLFKGAAISASTHPGPLYDFYVALLEKGMRPTMARLTLARKIATITLTMWKKGVDFDAQQLNRQAA